MLAVPPSNGRMGDLVECDTHIGEDGFEIIQLPWVQCFLCCWIIAVLECLVVSQYFCLFQVGNLAQRNAVYPVEYPNIVVIPLREQVDDGISSRDCLAVGIDGGLPSVLNG